MKGLLISVILFLNITTFAKEEDRGWGLSLGEGTSNIRIGGRIQAIGVHNFDTGFKDLYLRRARVNLQYQTQRHHMIYMDLRNDNLNEGDQGEGSLSIGDAFYEIPIDSPFIDDITLFRSKVDVSYSQTASSKDLIHPNRSRVSDYASNFVVHNRRATNLQANGGNDWLTYQLVISDGIQSEEVEKLSGTTTISNISKQDLTYGAKARFYLWNGVDNKKAELQETFYGAKKTLSFGLGAFVNPKIQYTLSDGRKISHSRTLYNGEISFAYNHFRFLAEGFLFKGDILDPSQSRFGDAWGTYMRSEYILGKVAPYIGLNYLRRDKNQRDSYETSQLVGINYYAQKKSRRYGISFENIENGRLIGLSDRKKVMTYLLLDY